MRTFRRLGAVLVASVLAGAIIAGPASPAGAASPEVFGGRALGRALDLSVLGKELTFGLSDANVTSKLVATASGAGQLLVTDSKSAARATKDKLLDGDFAALKCGLLLPVNLAPLLSMQDACSASQAELSGANFLPHARSTGFVERLEIGVNSVTDGLLGGVVDPVQEAIGPILESVFEPLTGVGLDHLGTTVKDLVDSVLDTTTLEASIGATTSEVTTLPARVTSVATANAATIKVLPMPKLTPVNGVANLDPILTITIAPAKAVASFDRVTGKSSASIDPALVRIKLNRLVAQALGALGDLVLNSNDEIVVHVGQTLTLFRNTPLESEIIVADGKTFENADGSASAVADGVSLHLLKGISGGIRLQLAHAEAGVLGAPAIADVPLEPFGAPAPPKPPVLPKTGSTPWMPIAGVGLFGLAVLVRRLTLSQR